VNGPQIEQGAIELADLPVDPGAFARGRRRGAGRDHRVEVMVDPHLEAILTHRLGQRARDDEAVQRKYGALARLDPKNPLVLGAFGHREDADGIGAQQDLRRDLERGAVPGHGREFTASPRFCERGEGENSLLSAPIPRH